MCLTTDKRRTEVFARRMPDKGKVKMWKEYRRDSTSTGRPRLRSTLYHRGFIKPGTVKSNREQQALGKDAKDSQEYCDWDHRQVCAVNRGIHVYSTRKPTFEHYSHSSYVYVPVYVEKKHLVAGNWLEGEAVFMQVTLYKKDYDAALNVR